MLCDPEISFGNFKEASIQQNHEMLELEKSCRMQISFLDVTIIIKRISLRNCSLFEILKEIKKNTTFQQK